MAELEDPEVSELHAMVSKNAREAREAIQKYESWRKSISENMPDFLELNRVLGELREVEGIINDEEGRGHGSLQQLEADLKTEEDALKGAKDHANDLQSLMEIVSKWCFVSIPLPFRSIA